MEEELARKEEVIPHQRDTIRALRKKLEESTPMQEPSILGA